MRVRRAQRSSEPRRHKFGEMLGMNVKLGFYGETSCIDANDILSHRPHHPPSWMYDKQVNLKTRYPNNLHNSQFRITIRVLRTLIE